jgi:hypothetical protein
MMSVKDDCLVAAIFSKDAAIVKGSKLDFDKFKVKKKNHG